MLAFKQSAALCAVLCFGLVCLKADAARSSHHPPIGYAKWKPDHLPPSTKAAGVFHSTSGQTAWLSLLERNTPGGTEAPTGTNISTTPEREFTWRHYYLRAVIFFLAFTVFCCALGKFCGIYNWITLSPLNTIACIPLHVSRCFMDAEMLHGNLISSAELAQINRPRKRGHEFRILDAKGKITGMNERLIPSLLAYRRSYIIAAAFFQSIATAIAMKEFYNFIKSWGEWQQWADAVNHIDYGEYKKNQGWVDSNETTDQERIQQWIGFSQMVFQGMFATLKVQTGWIDAGALVLQLCCNTTAILMYIWSSCHWDTFLRSSRISRWGFILLTLPPLIITALPTRLFVDFHSVDPIAKAYATEFSKYTYSQVELWSERGQYGCQQLTQVSQGGDLRKAVQTVSKVCRNVRRFVPNRHVKCCSIIKVIDFAGDQLHHSCGAFNQQVEQGTLTRVEDVITYADEHICSFFKDPTTQEYDSAAKIHGTRDNYTEAVNYFADNNMVTTALREGTEFSICLLRGLTNFNLIFSVAMSVGPALFYGAFKLKMIVPMSEVPGFLLMLYPWIYCPFLWCVYNVIFQLIGTNDLATILFPAMMLITFSPMVYIFYGLFVVNIMDPLIDKQMDTFSYHAWGIEIVMKLTGYSLLCFFMYRMWRTRLVETGDESWDDFMIWMSDTVGVNSSYFATVIITIVADYFVCDLTGSDYLWIHVATLRRNELVFRYIENEATGVVHLKQAPQAGADAACGPPKTGTELRKLALDRAARLDALASGLFGDGHMVDPVPVQNDDAMTEGMSQSFIESEPTPPSYEAAPAAIYSRTLASAPQSHTRSHQGISQSSATMSPVLTVAPQSHTTSHQGISQSSASLSPMPTAASMAHQGHVTGDASQVSSSWADRGLPPSWTGQIYSLYY
jgi:hypothetical protein